MRLFYVILLFFLLSCQKDLIIEEIVYETNLSHNLETNCIDQDLFLELPQQQRFSVYGAHCFQNKRLKIQTSPNGVDILPQTNAQALLIEEAKNSEKKQIEVSISENEKVIINNLPRPNALIVETEFNPEKKKLSDFLAQFLPLSLQEQNDQFIGQVDTRYELVFKLYENYLVLFKASKNLEDIPYLEQTSLVKVNTDLEPTTKDDETFLYMVPFLGYPLQYCRIEDRVFQGQITQNKQVNCTNKTSKEAYIQIDKNAFNYYNFLKEEKKDLFPLNYFFDKKKENNAWFMALDSIFGKSEADEIGFQSGFLVEFNPYKEPHTFHLIDLSDKKGDDYSTLAKLQIRHVDYKMHLSGGGFGKSSSGGIFFGENWDNDFEDFHDKTYVLVNFNTLTVENNFIAGGINNERRQAIIDFASGQANSRRITVGKNHISTTYSNKINETNIFKLSALREDQSRKDSDEEFIPKRWFIDQTLQVFGVFPTGPVSKTDSEETTSEERYDEYRQIRFHTNKQKPTVIEYVFSENSTKDPFFRKVVEDAIKVWNRSFAIITKNLPPIQVKLNQEHSPELGDIRYNYINLLFNNTRSFVGAGKGPSFTHRKTGQIISATANLFMDDTALLLPEYQLNVSNYIKYEVFKKDSHQRQNTQFYAKKIESHIWSNLGGGEKRPGHEYQILSSSLEEKINEKCKEVSEFVVKNKRSNLSLEDLETLLEDRKTSNLVSSCAQKFAEEEHVVSPYLQAQIKKFCPDVDDFIELHKKNKNKNPRQPLDNTKEPELMSSCARKIAREYILWVTLHEIGHNFGLSHNFKASTDVANFYADYDEIKSEDYYPQIIKSLFPNDEDIPDKAPQSSSVMDYPNHNGESLVVLGKYDLAALKQLYLDVVEVVKNPEECEVEGAEKECEIEEVKLNLKSNPDEQRPLLERLKAQTDKPRKNYRHCYDTLALITSDEYLCYRFDRGTTPLELVSNKIRTLKSFTQAYRYRYDRHLGWLNWQNKKFNPTVQKDNYIDYIMAYHHLWLEQKDNYLHGLGLELIGEYSLSNPSNTKDFKKIINPEHNDQFMTETFKEFFLTRDEVFQFFADYEFFRFAMECELKPLDSSKPNRFINLYHLMDSINEDFPYIEDCFSDPIQEFFKEKYEVVGQRGEALITHYGSDQYDPDAFADLYRPLYHEDQKQPWEDYYTNNGLPHHSYLYNAFFSFYPYYDPEWIEKIKTKTLEILYSLNDEKTAGKQTEDRLKLFTLFRSLILASTQNVNQVNRAIKIGNLQFLRVHKFNSKADFTLKILNVIEHLQNNSSPFLSQQWEKFKAENSFSSESVNDDFYNYLKNLDSTYISDDQEQALYIPFNSLNGEAISVKMIKLFKEAKRNLDNFTTPIPYSNEPTNLDVLMRSLDKKKYQQNTILLEDILTLSSQI